MARPYPWKCRSCGKQSLGPKVVDYSTEMEHDGRSYSFMVPGLSILECASCGEQVLPDDALGRVLDKLRSEAGLLTPTEIREQRKQLRLTQEQIASQLNVAKETVSRWETGGQIQQRGFDTLLRVYFRFADVRRYLAKKESGSQSSHQTAPPERTLAESTYVDVLPFKTNGPAALKYAGM